MHIHPAANWARTQTFTPEQVDCTTAVVLKILDGKCKMSTGEKAAVIAIYSVTQTQPGQLFDTAIHTCIEKARMKRAAMAPLIHQLRLEAESRIPKPTMKAYKDVLRSGLYG